MATIPEKPGRTTHEYNPKESTVYVDDQENAELRKIL